MNNQPQSRIVRSNWITGSLAAWLASCVAWTSAAPPEPLVHLPLTANLQDDGRLQLAAVARGVNFAADDMSDGALFDGARDSSIELARSPELDFAARPFTVAAWVKVDDSTSGDVLTRFDAPGHRGWLLSVVNNSACTSGQSNRQQVHFGIDAERMDAAPEDCGRPGEAVLIFALCSFQGTLYAGTCETGATGRGHVYQYLGGQAWRDCGSPDSANSVSVLAEIQGRLYAGTARYRLRGSSLPESENASLGGRVFRYEGDGRWTPCGKLGDSEALNGLVVYRGSLYASSIYSPGVYRYVDGKTWEPIGTPAGRRVEALTVYQDVLWGGGYDAAEVYRYTPEEGWKTDTALPDNTQTYGFGIFRGQLHVGTWPSGRVFRREDDGSWKDTGRLGEEKEVMPLAYYQGALWAGTLPLADVFRHDGQSWTSLGQIDLTPEVTYRRVWSMAVHEGRLFCGTLPSGKVHAFRAGRCATADLSRTAGWHHLAGVREANRLRLHIDGKTVAVSDTFDSEEFNLDVNSPLTIGNGPYASWRGRLADVRIYGEALDERAIVALADRSRRSPSAANEVGTSANAEARAQRPNILWLIAEDFGPHLGCYGTQQVSTPNLDRLAAEGVRYTRFFTTAPVCSASRSAFMTGMYQTTIGAHNHRSHRDDGFRLPPGVRLLSDRLRDAAYFTVNLRELPKSLGFRGTAKTDWNFTTDNSGFDSDRWSDLTRHQPFFAQLNFQETHRAFHAPLRADPAKVEIPPYYPDHPLTRSDWAAYLDAASELDRKVGLVIEQLKAEDLLESTVIVFFADNGQAHVRGKQFCYDSGLHVPLVIRWPSRFPVPEHFRPGSVDDRLLAAIDLAPTMLDTAGAQPSTTMQGEVFFGPRAGAPREYVFGARDRCDETVFRFRTVRDQRYRYIRNFTPERPFLQPNQYKERSYPVWNLLKELHAVGELTPPQAALCGPQMPLEELYDLAEDPHEIHNLVDSPSHQQVLAKLRTVLADWIAQSHDSGTEFEPPELAARKGVTKIGTPPNTGYALDDRPPEAAPKNQGE